jgi:ribokinase
MAKIIIVGSSNTDLVIKTEKMPMPGETVTGGKFTMAGGGKGANQAVAAARLGGDVAFIAKVGDDLFGRNSIERYKSENMDISHVVKDSESESGVALITVDEKGENCIAVAPGANCKLGKKDIDAAAEEFGNAEYILMQLEIPMETIEYAADIALKKGIKVILNPAPAATLPEGLLSKLFLITPNRTEASQLSGVNVTSRADAERAAEVFLSKGVKNVVITLGSEGALVKSRNSCTFVPAHKVKAVDTTAAGDTFSGAITVALSEGKSLDEAVEFATKASAISVTRLGAQPSVPYRKEIQ